MATTEQFSLRWNNFHSNLTSGFRDLLLGNDMVDVTLAVEGQFIQAHKLVLSICSPFFKQLFKINPCKHPVVILKDVSFGNLRDIIEFMYLGEVNVLPENFNAFLRTAELLQIKGLTVDDCSDTSSRKGDRSDDNDLEQDIQQFSQLIESCDVPNDNDVCNSYRNTRSPSLLDAASSNSKGISKSSNNRKRVKMELETHYESANADNFAQDPDKRNAFSDNDRFKMEPPFFLGNDEIGGKQSFMDDDTFSTLPTPVFPDFDDNNSSPRTKREIRCPYCRRKFVKSYNLKVHIRDQHDNTSLIDLDCVICGKTMKNRSCLRVHLYHHRKQEEVSFKESNDGFS